ncbi:MAG: tetratricopeptide repeat protein, partial [Candidatus Omnitrophica bacterium]|nr:tetratricopeptide repeat protein [Candidatus Omnitrophota bacterium]
MALTSRKLFHGLPVLVLLLALIAEVAPSQSFDREVPRRVRRSSNIESKIFRGNWWDYYNRGIRKFDEGDLVGAEADFREAIKYKSEGGPRARTYGVRFQEYFPYAELGAVLFEQGKYTEAIPILQKSLRTTQLEQSRFYLHEARKQAALSSPIDQYRPSLELLEPIQGIITNRGSILVRGVANDDLYVDSIVVQGQDLIIDYAQDRIDFETEVPLPRNTNEITVTVTDLVGRTASQSVIVQVDREGPVFSLRELKVSPTGTSASLTGTAFDPNGVQSIRVGQSDLAIQKGTSQTIDLKVDLEPGQSAIQVELADGFGNTTRALLDLTQKSGSAKPFGAIRVAALGFDPRWLVGAGASAPRIEF